jgi:hypothetical protein
MEQQGREETASGRIVVVRVSGEPFDIPLAELARHPQSALLALARSAADRGRTERGHALVEFPRDIRSFRVLRHYLATGELLVPDDPIERQLLATEAAFYGLEGGHALAMSNAELGYFGLPAVGAPRAAPGPQTGAPAALTLPAQGAPAAAREEGTPGGAWVAPTPAAIAALRLAAPAVGPEAPRASRDYWLQGARGAVGARAEVLTDEEAQMRSAELAARIAFGHGEDATALVQRLAVDLFGERPPAQEPTREHEKTPYSYLFWPAQPQGFGLRLRYVDGLEAFRSNFRALTLGLDDDLLSGLPFVAAGGAVLASLHVWPRVPVPEAGLVVAWRRDFEDEYARAWAGLWPPQRWGWGGDAIAPMRAQMDTMRAELEKLRPQQGPAATLSPAERDYLAKMVRMNKGLLGLQGDDSPKFILPKRRRARWRPAAEDSGSEDTDAGGAREGPGIEDPRPEGADTEDPHGAPDPGAHGGARARARAARGAATEGPQEAAERRAFNSMAGADVDLFLVTRNPDAALRALAALHARLQRRVGRLLVYRSKHSVTFVPPSPYRRIQVVLRLYHSAEQVVLGFDLDCCCVYYDGQRVVALPRAVRALRARYNLIDVSRQSTSYEARLAKYAKRGFDIAIPYGVGLGAAADAVRDRLVAHAAHGGHLPLQGLEVLLAMFEAAQRKDAALLHRLGASLGDYSVGGLPRPAARRRRGGWRRRQIQRTAEKGASMPCACGDVLDEVLLRAVHSYEDAQCPADVPPIIEFQAEAPHTQDRVDLLFTGSFNPVAAGWLPEPRAPDE